MTPTTLLAFTAALTIAAAVPGPGMTALVARALAVGFWGTMRSEEHTSELRSH